MIQIILSIRLEYGREVIQQSELLVFDVVLSLCALCLVDLLEVMGVGDDFGWLSFVKFKLVDYVVV
jgi:hypothetical protein